MDTEKPSLKYFPMADGLYCHVLPDRLLINRSKEVRKEPEQKDGPNMLMIALLMLLGIAAMFFFANFVLTQFYPMAFAVLAVVVAIVFGLRNQMRYSATDLIPRDKILKTTFHRKSIGYDYFVVHYRGANGKIYLRKINIYDSQEVNKQALELFYTEELI